MNAQIQAEAHCSQLLAAAFTAALRLVLASGSTCVDHGASKMHPGIWSCRIMDTGSFARQPLNFRHAATARMQSQHTLCSTRVLFSAVHTGTSLPRLSTIGIWKCLNVTGCCILEANKNAWWWRPALVLSTDRMQRPRLVLQWECERRPRHGIRRLVCVCVCVCFCFVVLTGRQQLDAPSPSPE